jgi:hypothetical protein
LNVGCGDAYSRRVTHVLRPPSRRTVIASRAKLSKPRNPRPNPIPSVEGCPRRGGVVSPPRGRNPVPRPGAMRRDRAGQRPARHCEPCEAIQAQHPRPAPSTVLRPPSRRGAPSLRSTGKPAIRTRLQVRSNPVPRAKQTDVMLPALDCRAPVRPTYRKCGGARNDGAPRAHHGQGEALPRAARRSPRTARTTHKGGFETRPYVAL